MLSVSAGEVVRARGHRREGAGPLPAPHLWIGHDEAGRPARDRARRPALSSCPVRVRGDGVGAIGSSASNVTVMRGYGARWSVLPVAGQLVLVDACADTRLAAGYDPARSV